MGACGAGPDTDHGPSWDAYSPGEVSIAGSWRDAGSHPGSPGHPGQGSYVLPDTPRSRRRCTGLGVRPSAAHPWGSSCVVLPRPRGCSHSLQGGSWAQTSCAPIPGSSLGCGGQGQDCGQLPCGSKELLSQDWKGQTLKTEVASSPLPYHGGSPPSCGPVGFLAQRLPEVWSSPVQGPPVLCLTSACALCPRNVPAGHRLCCQISKNPFKTQRARVCCGWGLGSYLLAERLGTQPRGPAHWTRSSRWLMHERRGLEAEPLDPCSGSVGHLAAVSPQRAHPTPGLSPEASS